jgi:glycosyltransferase involved in cell wall biosynthesis
MKLKTLVKAPALSQSGYGEHARFVLRALKTREDLFDIYLENLNWGKTSWLWIDNEEREWMDSLLMKTIAYRQSKGTFDLSIQVTIPNEWEKIAPINIGCTAGIETTKISPEWVQKSYLMDKIIVVSEFARQGFLNTVYEATNSQTGETREMSAKGPIEVVNYPFKSVPPTELTLNLKNDFNFLAVSQWSPRKNTVNTICWFVEEFHDQDVGLVLKISLANNSYADFNQTRNNVKALLADPKYSDRKCSVHLVHGYLNDDEMSALYQHPKIKALVNIAHGEGYGLPIFEAAGYGLPVVTIPWSGQTDFLYVPEKVKGSRKKKPMAKFAEVEYQIAPVQKEAVWPGVLQEDSQWAYADQGSFKMKLREVYKKYSVYEKRALVLQEYVRSRFTEEKIYGEFIEKVSGQSRDNIKKINGISFCIPTNGRRESKTRITVNSIRRELGSFPHEIIICGDTDNFTDLEDVILIDRKEEAHTRRVASLRNSAAEASKHDVIAWCDDDIVIHNNWKDGLISFSKNNGWDVLGCKILNPDATRHWDRGTINPRTLVSYDYPSYSENLLQTSGFLMVRREVFERVKWDESKLVFADRVEGQIPEDLQFSVDLRRSGYSLSFCQDIQVWHNDEQYTEWGNQTLYKQVIQQQTGLDFFPEPSGEFLELTK